MNQYFFSVSKAERENILDQHKSLYDGYVTRYNTESNMTPLYVQDLANDKGGLTVSNKGNVTTYKNFGINEDIDRTDRIGDGPDDLKHGTVDLDSETNPEHEIMHDQYGGPEDDYISLGITDSGNDDEAALITILDVDDEEHQPGNYEFDIDEVGDFMSGAMNEEKDFENVDEDQISDVMSSINESLDMFKRFKKYN